MRLAIPLVLSSLALAPFAAAQAAWTNITAGIQPPNRTEIGMVSDSAGLWMFGGLDGSTQTVYGDTWFFDGTTWTQSSPAISPPPRSRFAMAWDLFRAELVIFGGDATFPSGRLGDTWTFNGTNWTQHTPATSPSVRIHARMAHDIIGGRVLMFGGSGALSETWAWDGVTWTQLTPATTPPGREQTHMASNIDTGEIVMFGGATGGASGIMGDTWIWNGADWRQVMTATIPGGTGLRNGAVTYDAVRKRVVLYGGVAGAAPIRPGLAWEFDGVDWQARNPTPAPSARNGGGFAFVAATGQNYAFAGFNGGSVLGETWSYQTPAVAAATAFGQGCPSSVGPAALSANRDPWMGDTMDLQFGPVPATGLPYLILGYSDTVWSGGALPFNLGVFGFGSCVLEQSTEDALFAPGGMFSLAIPVNPAFVGLQFFLQGAILEPGPQLGLGLSTGLRCTVGAR